MESVLVPNQNSVIANLYRSYLSPIFIKNVRDKESVWYLEQSVCAQYKKQVRNLEH